LLGEEIQNEVLKHIAEMSILQGKDGTTIDSLMEERLGHIFGPICTPYEVTSSDEDVSEDAEKEISSSSGSEDDNQDADAALATARLQRPETNTKKTKKKSKKRKKKASVKDKVPTTTEDKIIGQWRFTVLSSDNVKSIQEARNKKRYDDMRAKAAKKQAKLDAVANAAAATAAEAQTFFATPPPSTSSQSQTPIGLIIGSTVVIPKKRAGKYKCAGSFCQGESCKTKATGWTICPNCDMKVCPKGVCQHSMTIHILSCQPQV
jgi:hypothetical protein